MTPQEHRQKSIIANNTREQLHGNCGVSIKQTGPHWGLYCQNSKCSKPGQWISWVSKDKLRRLLKK
jgi:hypothetical protein